MEKTMQFVQTMMSVGIVLLLIAILSILGDILNKLKNKEDGKE